jgi:hypothetical protein
MPFCVSFVFFFFALLCLFYVFQFFYCLFPLFSVWFFIALPFFSSFSPLFFLFFFWLTSLAYPNLLGTKRLGCCTLSESVYTLGCKPIHFHSLGYVIHQVVCEKGYFGIILQPMTCIHNVFTWVVSCCMHILFQGNVSQREQA